MKTCPAALTAIAEGSLHILRDGADVPSRVDSPYGTVVGVGHEDVARGVDGDSQGVAELSSTIGTTGAVHQACLTVAGDGRDIAVRVNPPDPVVVPL